MDVAVTLDVHDDGSGVVEVDVTLDEDAVERLGGNLDRVLELDDLRAAGWAVEGPVPHGGGGAALTARKAFAGPAAARPVLHEITGADGALRRFRVERSAPFARTEWAVRGVIDLRGGIEAFGDDELAEELDGLAVGRPVEAIELEAGRPLEEVVGVTVEVRLPGGDVRTNATASSAQGGTWEVPLGEGPVRIEAASSQQRTEVLWWIGAGLLLGALLVLLLAVRAGRAIRRRRRGDRRPSPAHAAGSAGTVSPSA